MVVGIIELFSAGFGNTRRDSQWRGSRGGTRATESLGSFLLERARFVRVPIAAVNWL